MYRGLHPKKQFARLGARELLDFSVPVERRGALEMADWREAPRATDPANIILPDALATSFFLKRRGVGKFACSDAEVETIPAIK